ncbi:8594_t:CDS:2 [Racocetra persica]|uniref:8594_t:CDS:1 n=1 Tax=Racocetra persica TaxID=160502 RepID=A0ACA9PWF2_9GLOM|nr:8594_t:CDS:2 [Racocetra persica]
MYKSFPAPKWSSLILLLGFLFGVFSSIINVVNAVPADIPGIPDLSNPNISNPTTTVAQSSGELTPHEIVVGIILVVTGIIYCFFGRRVYYLTLFLIGFYIGVIATWMALTNNEPPGGFSGTKSPTIILLVSLAVGVFVGLLFICCAEIAIWLLGALAGYLFALFILAWASGGVIHSSTGRIILIIVCAYAIILGVDMFVRTGFAQSVVTFLDGNHNLPAYETNPKIYIMLAAMVVAFILGNRLKNMGKEKQSEKAEKSEHPTNRA